MPDSTPERKQLHSVEALLAERLSRWFYFKRAKTKLLFIVVLAAAYAQAHAQLVVNPPSLTFPPQAFGTTSAGQDVNLTYSGATPLSTLTFLITPPFAQTNTCEAKLPLPPGSSCKVTVTITPQPTLPFTGTLNIFSAGGAPIAVMLFGTPPSPGDIALSPSSLNFPPQRDGTTSPSQPITVTSTGGGPVGNITVSASLPFAEFDDCGGKVLVPGDHCVIQVTVKPTTPGPITGQITVNWTSDLPRQSLIGLTAFGISNANVLATTGDFPIRLTGDPFSTATGELVHAFAADL